MNRINRIVPITDVTDEKSKKIVQIPNEDGSDNIKWKVIALAYMDTGELLPVLWNGHLTFNVYDPVNEVMIDTNINKKWKVTN